MQKKLLAACVIAGMAIGMAFGAYASEKPSQHPQEMQIALKMQDPAPAIALVAEVPAAQVQVSVPHAFKPIDYASAKAKWDAGDTFGAIVALLFGSGGVMIGMTTLAANKPRAFELGDFNEVPVVATDIIYEGAAVSWDGTSVAKPLVAGDRFIGFADRKADNQTVAGAAGAINVRVRTRGMIELPITSITYADIGKAVFASDDDTFTLTQGANSYIGRVVRVVGTGTATVAFDAQHGGFLAELTDSSGGTANDTIAAVEASFVQATLANNFADLAAKVNYLLRLAKGGA